MVVDIPGLRPELTNINDIENQLKTMVGDDGRHHCPECGSHYKFKTVLEKHLRTKHNWPNPIDRVQDTAIVPTMMKLLFLQHDSANAYVYGDGDRAMRNALSPTPSPKHEPNPTVI